MTFHAQLYNRILKLQDEKDKAMQHINKLLAHGRKQQQYINYLERENREVFELTSNIIHKVVKERNDDK